MVQIKLTKIILPIIKQIDDGIESILDYSAKTLLEFYISLIKKYPGFGSLEILFVYKGIECKVKLGDEGAYLPVRHEVNSFYNYLSATIYLPEMIDADPLIYATKYYLETAEKVILKIQQKALEFDYKKSLLFTEHINFITNILNKEINFMQHLDEILYSAATILNSSEGLLFIRVEQECYVSSFGMNDNNRAELLSRFQEERSVSDLCKISGDSEYQTAIIDKIGVDERNFGILVFNKKECRDGYCEFDDYDRKLSSTLSNEIAIALKKYTLFNREKKQAALLKSVMDSVTNAIIASDKNLVPILVNKRGRELFRSQGTLFNKKISSLLPKLSPVRKFILETEGTNSVLKASNLPLSAGNPKILNVAVSPLIYEADSGCANGNVYTFEDVTEMKNLKENFSRYVSGEVFDKIVSKRQKNRLGGENIECAIFFSDIRGFTGFSENLPPEEVVETLNGYFNLMLGCVVENGGYIDKLVGDEIMAVFRENESYPNPSLNAVNTALAMKTKLSLFNEMRIEEHKPTLHFGVGINYGKVVIGNIGSFQRMDYTIIGDNVNLAARLCSAAGKEEIIITESVNNLISGKINTQKLPSISVKGKSGKINIYHVI